MGDKGYLASLKETTKFLEVCEYMITFEKENGKESKMYVKAAHLDWHIETYFPSKGYQVLAVSKLDSAEIPEIAKEITDQFAKKQYSFEYNNGSDK